MGNRKERGSADQGGHWALFLGSLSSPVIRSWAERAEAAVGLGIAAPSPSLSSPSLRGGIRPGRIGKS